MFRRRFLLCPERLALDWDNSLRKVGYTVYPFATSPEAKVVHRERYGRLWQEDLLDGDMGGLVLDESACAWVIIGAPHWFTNLALPAGHFGMHVWPLPLHQIWRSRRQRMLIASVKQSLLKQGAREMTFREAREPLKHSPQ
jgi:hypothetical protein